MISSAGSEMAAPPAARRMDLRVTRMLAISLRLDLAMDEGGARRHVDQQRAEGAPAAPEPVGERPQRAAVGGGLATPERHAKQLRDHARLQAGGAGAAREQLAEAPRPVERPQTHHLAVAADGALG